jgi:selenium metabolism protein YedF
MYTIDTKGHLCPEPLIMARNGLKEVSEGERVLIISDNETSFHNLMSFLSDLGASPQIKQKGSEYHIEVIKPGESGSNKETNPEAYCNVNNEQDIGATSNYIVVVRGSEMGEGDADLGRLLIRGYFNALKGMDRLPTHIIMYNGGVKLALKNTDTVEALGELEDKGVSVLVCGTCVDFFELKGEIGAGRISNMYQIATTLADTGHVVYL